MPKVWTKGNYKRLSVDRDLLGWCGWNSFERLLAEVPEPLTRDLIVVTFSCMARINEALPATTDMFKVKPNYVLVEGLSLEKRWRKLGVQLYCSECKQVNEPRAVICSKCGANLLMVGKRKFQTEKIETVRIPFNFPTKEPQAHYLQTLLESRDGLLFPELNRANPRYGRRTAYNLMRQIDGLVVKYIKVPHAWNHLWVALRGHCLGEEYDMDELEIKNFSSRVKSETVSKYVKKRKSYARKMGIA